MSAVILEPTKINSVTVSIFYPSICHEVMGLDAMILVFWMLSFKPAISLMKQLTDSNWERSVTMLYIVTPLFN